MRTAAEKMQAARTSLVLDSRTAFFGVLALKLKIVPDPTCERAWVDGVSLGYNPTYIDSLTLDRVKGVVMHEVLHPAMGHNWRRDGRSPKRYNRACDYAINPIIVESGFTLPDNVCLDDAYKGKSAEWIYARLDDEPEDPQAGDEGDSGDDGDEGGQEAAGGSQGDDDDGDGQQSPGDGDDGSQGDSGDDDGDGDGTGDGQGDDGQGSGTAPGSGTPDLTSNTWDGVRDAPADAAEQDAGEADWKRFVQEAANAAAAQGNLPGNLKRFVEEITRQRMDWRSLLRRFMQEASKLDYTFTRPNRAYVPHGLYVPSLHAEGMGPVVVGFDTSMSIDDITVSVFGGETRDVIDEAQPIRTHVVYCDTRVAHVDTFEQGDPVEIVPHGGGGTDFRPVFEYADSLDEPPAALIYLTDLMGDFPEHAPDYPVFWATVKPLRELPEYYHPPFGEVVEIDC